MAIVTIVTTVNKPANKVKAVCKFTHSLFQVVGTRFEQAVNNL